MKLGFLTAILPDLSLEEIVRFAAAEDFTCIEVCCWPPSKADRRYSGITHIDVTALDAGDAQRIQDLFAAEGVEISGLGYYPNPLTPHMEQSAAAVEHIQRVISAAALLGVGQMNTFVGRDWTRSIDDNWPRFLTTWRPIVQFAEDQGVRIGIENCPMLFSNDEWPAGKNLAHSPAIWRRMFEDIPSSNFGLNYDPSHMVWQHMDYLAPIREFRDRIFHVHAKDVRVDQYLLNDVGVLAFPPAYHTPKLPGMGDVDWGRFCSVLTDVGYRGPVCVEVEDRAYEDSLDRRKASLHQSRVYLRNFIPG